jgi:hypothetical protein
MSPISHEPEFEIAHGYAGRALVSARKTSSMVKRSLPTPVLTISVEMLYPILPIFLSQTLKASGSVVGLIEGIAGATQRLSKAFSHVA